MGRLRVGVVVAAVVALSGWLSAGAGMVGAVDDGGAPKVSGERRLVSTQLGNRPRFASSGSGSLAVWTEGRQDNAGVYGSLLDAHGRAVEPQGFPVATDGPNKDVSVVFTGSSYLVFWAETRTGESTVEGTRVSLEGTVLDPTPILFASNGYQREMRFPEAAVDGDQVLITWTEGEDVLVDGRRPYTDVFGVRWSASSGVLDSTPIPIGATPRSAQYFPDVVSYGGGWLVAWADTPTGDIVATRVDRDGDVLDPTGFTFGSDGGTSKYLSLAFDGTNVLVVWTVFLNDGPDDVLGARWSPSTGLLDTTPIEIATGGGTQWLPSVAFNGTFLVVWQQTNADVWGARIDSDGTVVDPDGFPVSTHAKPRDAPGDCRRHREQVPGQLRQGLNSGWQRGVPADRPQVTALERPEVVQRGSGRLIGGRSSVPTGGRTRGPSARTAARH